MRKLHSSALVAILGLFVFSQANLESARAQTEFTFTTGPWAAFLPKYEAISSVDNGFSPQSTNLFRDSQDGVGFFVGVGGLHHFMPTRTILESNFVYARADSISSMAFFNDPGPAQSIWFAGPAGGAFVATPDGGNMRVSLDSDVQYTSRYLGLRDQFAFLQRFGLGMLTIGAGASNLQLRQDFLLDGRVSNGVSAKLQEDLDSTYWGGEARATLTKYVGNVRSMLDMRFGVYDLDVEYGGTFIARNAGGAVTANERVLSGIGDVATTFDLGIRFDTIVKGIWIRPSLSAKYVSDLPAMNHPQTIVGGPRVAISTEKGVLLRAGIELVF